jgi:hypothetical protein
VQSFDAFSSPVGVLAPEAVNLDQREKLTVRQLGGVAGISAHGRMISRIAALCVVDILCSAWAGHVLLRSSVGVSGENVK